MKYNKLNRWFLSKDWRPFPFQLQVWDAYNQGRCGLLNAPTGSGKTYALWLAFLNSFLEEKRNVKGLKLIWITPLRALAKDLHLALQEAATELGLNWDIALRTGDTTTQERQKHARKMPDCLVTTPESLHIMLSQKNAAERFGNLEALIVDEWHELISTKRGTQVELAAARLRGLSGTKLRIWGISATIGNLEEAADVLLGEVNKEDKVIVRAKPSKKIEVVSVVPENMKELPWAGHLGIRMVSQVLKIIKKSNTCLIFTNTRSQAELWYRGIIEEAPELSGLIALHHGSIDLHIRRWVEDALKEGKLKAVVCTSSLDLGVDFAPVDVVMQIGGPKGVSRFMQRAGRSGHQPGALSRIYFVPTHSLELIEGAALRDAIEKQEHEERTPMTGAIDVLVQFLVTLAVSDGFYEEEIYKEIKSTYTYKNLSPKEWKWVLQFITTGGDSLSEYQEYSKVEVHNGFYKVYARKIQWRHRMSIGTIVGDTVLRVKFLSGGTLGTVEESFIGILNPGDSFWFSGRCLEFIKVKDLVAYVKKSNKKSGLAPKWAGGKLPLSSKLAAQIRVKLTEAKNGVVNGPEMKAIEPLLQIQQMRSLIPSQDELLIEKTMSEEGCHIYFYPFEGRFVHEVLGALVAFRISKLMPVTFSIAMNDYGFELLSDQDIPIEEALESDLFSMEHFNEDLETCLNKTEMAVRKFRDIAVIAGLLFQGAHDKPISNKHLQASAGIIYRVFKEYDEDNLLLAQAMEEVVTTYMDYNRLLSSMRRINQQKLVLTHTKEFSPFAFPIMVDGLREKVTSEKLADRIARYQLQEM